MVGGDDDVLVAEVTAAVVSFMQRNAEKTGNILVDLTAKKL